VRLIAWFQLVMGAGILGIWPVLLLTGEVPEIAAGQRDIWFHIVAEAIAGALLLAAGWRLLRRRDTGARLLSSFALGGLLYTGVNSAGYYAELGAWGPMAMLAAFGVLAGVSFVGLSRRPDPSDAYRPASR
jgi:peptidoglycan/LPS O-acetylase OafA/YrhL